MAKVNGTRMSVGDAQPACSLTSRKLAQPISTAQIPRVTMLSTLAAMISTKKKKNRNDS
jgi:hypothetical protein